MSALSHIIITLCTSPFTERNLNEENYPTGFFPNVVHSLFNRTIIMGNLFVEVGNIPTPPLPYLFYIYVSLI
jgi:hypothetical protein